MTNEPSKEAKQRACDLANKVAEELQPGRPNNHWIPHDYGNPQEGALTALARHIQQTSDVAKAVRQLIQGTHSWTEQAALDDLKSLILPDEKPDPLVDVVEKVLAGFETQHLAETYAAQIRTHLRLRNLKIVEADHD